MIRAIVLWLLLLALPVQSWAAVTMTHCKDVQGKAAQDASPHHDHAAMMRQMAEAAAGGDHSEHHGHHAMPSSDDMVKHAPQQDMDGTAASADVKTKAKALGCECGCDCGGNCAVACAVPLTALTGGTSLHDLGKSAMLAAALPSQAMAAHRFTPLRPPSVAAL